MNKISKPQSSNEHKILSNILNYSNKPFFMKERFSSNTMSDKPARSVDKAHRTTAGHFRPEQRASNHSKDENSIFKKNQLFLKHLKNNRKNIPQKAHGVQLGYPGAQNNSLGRQKSKNLESNQMARKRLQKENLQPTQPSQLSMKVKGLSTATQHSKNQKFNKNQLNFFKKENSLKSHLNHLEGYAASTKQSPPPALRWNNHSGGLSSQKIPKSAITTKHPNKENLGQPFRNSLLRNRCSSGKSSSQSPNGQNRLMLKSRKKEFCSSVYLENQNRRRKRRQQQHQNYLQNTSFKEESFENPPKVAKLTKLAKQARIQFEGFTGTERSLESHTITPGNGVIYRFQPQGSEEVKIDQQLLKLHSKKKKHRKYRGGYQGLRPATAASKKGFYEDSIKKVYRMGSDGANYGFTEAALSTLGQISANATMNLNSAGNANSGGNVANLGSGGFMEGSKPYKGKRGINGLTRQKVSSTSLRGTETKSGKLPRSAVNPNSSEIMQNLENIEKLLKYGTQGISSREQAPQRSPTSRERLRHHHTPKRFPQASKSSQEHSFEKVESVGSKTPSGLSINPKKGNLNFSYVVSKSKLGKSVLEAEELSYGYQSAQNTILMSQRFSFVSKAPNQQNQPNLHLNGGKKTSVSPSNSYFKQTASATTDLKYLQTIGQVHPRAHSNQRRGSNGSSGVGRGRGAAPAGGKFRDLLGFLENKNNYYKTRYTFNSVDKSIGKAIKLRAGGTVSGNGLAGAAKELNFSTALKNHKNRISAAPALESSKSRRMRGFGRGRSSHKSRLFETDESLKIREIELDSSKTAKYKSQKIIDRTNLFLERRSSGTASQTGAGGQISHTVAKMGSSDYINSTRLNSQPRRSECLSSDYYSHGGCQMRPNSSNGLVCRPGRKRVKFGRRAAEECFSLVQDAKGGSGTREVSFVEAERERSSLYYEQSRVVSRNSEVQFGGVGSAGSSQVQLAGIKGGARGDPKSVKISEIVSQAKIQNFALSEKIEVDVSDVAIYDPKQARKSSTRQELQNLVLQPPIDLKSSKSTKTTFSQFRAKSAKKPKFEDFEIGQVLGTGKFGEVRLARHRKTGFLVALKKVSKMKVKMHRCENMLVSELLIHLSLDHPNIVKLYTYFSHQESVYMVLEAACGGNLFEKLKELPQGCGLGEGVVADVLRQLCAGLEYLHANDIIHRDIKPENILFNLVSFDRFRGRLLALAVRNRHGFARFRIFLSIFGRFLFLIDF